MNIQKQKIEDTVKQYFDVYCLLHCNGHTFSKAGMHTVGVLCFKYNQETPKTAS